MISPEMLRRYPFFAGLGAHTLKQIAMLGEEETVPAEGWLFREGDVAHYLYLVVDGAVTLSFDVNTEGDRPIEVTTLSAGELVGWSSLVAPHTYKLGAQATEETQLIVIDAVALRDLLDENPVAGYELMHSLAGLMGERLMSLRVQFVSLAV